MFMLADPKINLNERDQRNAPGRSHQNATDIALQQNAELFRSELILIRHMS